MVLERATVAARIMKRIVARDAKPAYLYNRGVLWPLVDGVECERALIVIG